MIPDQLWYQMWPILKIIKKNDFFTSHFRIKDGLPYLTNRMNQEMKLRFSFRSNAALKYRFAPSSADSYTRSTDQHNVSIWISVRNARFSTEGPLRANDHKECFAPFQTTGNIYCHRSMHDNPRAHQACASMENLRNYNVISHHFLQFWCIFLIS